MDLENLQYRLNQENTDYLGHFVIEIDMSDVDDKAAKGIKYRRFALLYYNRI